MAKIVRVEKNSIADNLGIKVGDELLGFNNHILEDILDYTYFECLEEFTMTVKNDKEEIDFEIEKEYWEPIGIELDKSVELSPIRCKNKCKFCFVDQLPKGMDESLYVRDDDYRLSFLSGNFITLTNLGENEIERILRLKLSPLYISVHATDGNVKKHLIANPEGTKTLEKLTIFAQNGISMHAQIVLCPYENDGKILEKTLNDLQDLMPYVKTVAVVPVGLTGHREGLYKLKGVSKEDALKTINFVESFNKKNGGQFVWCSDEFYVKADTEFPKYSEYGDFEQIENGVGLAREFEKELETALEFSDFNDKSAKIFSITGESFAKFLENQKPKIKSKFPNVDLQICVVKNDFFGHSITVTGLITGKDIINQFSDIINGDVILPSNMVRTFPNAFIDGVKIKELEEALNAKSHICGGGEQLIEIIENILAR